MSEQNKQLVRRYYDQVMNGRELDSVIARIWEKTR